MIMMALYRIFKKVNAESPEERRDNMHIMVRLNKMDESAIKKPLPKRDNDD